MFKIVTKRTEAEEEALRAEGREEARKEQSDHLHKRVTEMKIVANGCVGFVLNDLLRVGDVLVNYDPPRFFAQDCRVVYVDNRYPEDKGGQETRPGTVWVEFEPCSYGGRSGGSLLNDTDRVLIDKRGAS